MERTMSVEDKIRRAEEIYNRRRENEYRVSTTRVSVENNENTFVNKRLKKMIIQIILCMTIYFVFYYITNNNYTISGDLKNKCREILSYDISLSEMYKKISIQVTSIKEKYQQMIENVEQDNNEKEEQGEKIDNEESQEQKVEGNGEVENQEQNVEQQNNGENANEEVEPQANIEENIGGPIEEIANAELKVEQEKELTEEEQMKKDSEEIKEKISFIKPLEGIVTSNFGWRNPKSSTVSKYHTGIDVGAKEGTNIISATNGKVVLASSEGSYGNHLKIQVEDISIIYAHCLSLEVKEGDEIKQGQIIAKVGSTGNSTGPHLHFEIRRENRYVDPKLILDF